MGAGPIGAVVCGYLVESFGPQIALLLASSGMLVVIFIVAFGSGLWKIEGHIRQSSVQVEGEAPGVV